MTSAHKQHKILVVGPAWVGDMVMAQTLFTTVKQQHPDAIIDVLAPDWSRPLLERMPEVRKPISLPIGHGEFKWSLRREIGKSLRAEAYDEAFVLPNSLKSALIPFWAKIPVRTGWMRECRWGLLNDIRSLDKDKYPLMIERFMALAYPKNAELPKPYPKPCLVVNKDSVQQALTKYQLNQPASPILAICPGAEFGPAKRWPEYHYADVAREKLDKGWQVWIFGSQKDQPVAKEIQAFVEGRCIDLTGKTTLADAIDLMSLATQVVSNDSGLMHIAAALGRPLVAVYGSSSPKFTPPLSPKVEIISLGLECSPCFKRECPLGHLNCLKQLPASQVIAALDKLGAHD